MVRSGKIHGDFSGVFVDSAPDYEDILLRDAAEVDAALEAGTAVVYSMSKEMFAVWEEDE